MERWSPIVVKWFGVLAVAAMVVSCGGRVKPTTLGGLKYEASEEEKLEFESMSHEEVREEYKELMDLFQDKVLKEQIERRIADVYMMEGVQDQLKAKPKKSYYVDAIKSYREILEKYPNSPDNAEVFYQLAKAYDMEGEQQEALTMLQELTARHPTYANISEAYFRMGDIYFNLQAYAKAERAYVAVTQSTNQALKLNAQYMLGWSYYKQLKFDSALSTFAEVLQAVMAEHKTVEELGKSQKPFAEDSLHSISLTLARSGGPEMISATELLATQHYVWMIYENLGEYYLEKERFEDSALTYRLYVSQYKDTEQAPRLHQRLIDSYIEGGFGFRAIQEKETYVAYYGIYANYPGNKDGLREDLKAPLKQYIEELAKHYHSNAQTLGKTLADDSSGKAPLKAKKKVATTELMVAAYDSAAEFYQQYVETFVNGPRTGEMTFLKAEARFEAGRFEQAVSEYETVAYELKDEGHDAHGADAGYAAIISYQKLIDQFDKPEDAKGLQQKAVESMLKFAQVFHADERSPSVLTNAAEYLFGLDQYEKAIEVSEGLITNNNLLDLVLKKTAYGIAAHSYFKLEDYVSAERNYIQQRNLVKPESEEYTAITERIAATLYKQSEVLVAKGNKEEAIEALIKVKQLAPNSPIRFNAQYDAATMMLELEQWQKSINEFLQLTELFPGHKLAPEFPRKIAFAYEKLKSWTQAAEVYLALSVNDPDANRRREALFAAAQMTENAEQYEEAIKLFKRYAHSYEKPFDARMEARYHLATLYDKIDDKNRSLFWLRRIVAGDQDAGRARTERSRWLAAWANMEYGDYFAWEFQRKRLRWPLNQSLPAKNKALQDAISRYQMSADYELLEFVSQSSVKIAGLYEDFAKALRAVPAPKGLSADDKNQYALIIEEQAEPFVELAVELYYSNVDLAWNGHFDDWISKSFTALAKLQPKRFAKQEYEVSYGDEIR